jgi:DNA 3'-phosphatase
MNWYSIKEGTCFYNFNLSEDKSLMLKDFIGFDFDDTLVSFKKKEITSNVIDTLRLLSETYNIVIFSNQLGVKRGKVSNKEVQEIFETFIKRINIPIIVFYSIDEDIYRKPNVGMYNLFMSIFKENKLKYYCGDAAGRIDDFSTSDLFFANNCSIQFKVPEEVFYDSYNHILANKNIKSLDLYKEDKWNNGKLSNPRNIFRVDNIKDCEMYDLEFTKDKMIIVMVGAPGSGKSSLTKYLSDKYLMGIINGDTIGSKNKQIKKFQEYLNLVDKEELYGIIIDNTNPSKSDRDFWFNKVDDTWDKEIVYINISKPISFHMTNYRTNFGYKKIPSIAIHSFYKKLEEPKYCINYNNVLTNIDYNHNLRFVWR